MALSALILAHFAMGALSPAIARWFGERAWFVSAMVPLGSFVWLLTQAPTMRSGGAVLESHPWIEVLGVNLDFRMGLLQWVLSLVVTGIGVLVLFYSRWYFHASPTATRCMGLLTAFAGAMLGLVTTDNTVVLYTFWELTTVFSYLLIGNDYTRKANRGAALTSLIVTTFGGLAMLVGLVLLRVITGNFSLADVVANPPHSTAAAVAGVLILVGALTKSALFPFHFWLPGAMAAATPISAYLHAAAMVKAGVYLVALLAPVFSQTAGWRVIISLLGAITLVLGGWRALRQNDIKLLLAYGTVSQLGFMVLLMGMGTRAGALAGLAMLVTHALFKATLFLTVGIIDKSAGTRDLKQLSGVGRQKPVLLAAAALAAASMAGLPPLVGFIAKESALEALLTVASDERRASVAPAIGVLTITAIVAGSMLTTAYSARFLWGAFARKPGLEDTTLEPKPWGMSLAPVLLGVLSLLGGFAGPTLTEWFAPYWESMRVGSHPHGLALWHGFTLPLALSVIAIGGGLLLFWQREAVSALQATFPTGTSAHDRYLQVMRVVDQAGVEVTSRAQQGSLVVTLTTIFNVLLLGVGVPLMVTRTWPSRISWYDSPSQLAIGVVMMVAAVLVTVSRGRVRAVLLVGVTGYGVALLFLLHGAPDLALTQVLVESVTVVVFLLVMRRMPRYFTNRPLAASRWWRAALALSVGTLTVLLTVVASGVRMHSPASEPLYRAAKEFGYGNNIVNVILVDTRAWDTLGEVSVLVIAATGVTSLIFLRTRTKPRQRRTEVPAAETTGTWLRGTRDLDPAARSLLFEVATRFVFGITVVVGLWLLLRGHNAPGGGFAGGLLVGMALVVRYLAAGRSELNEAAPFDAGRLLGAGLLVSVLSALAPVFFGGSVLQSFDAYVRLGPEPWLGTIHLVSSVFFDMGVFLIVIGVLLDYARSLGSGVDLQASEHKAPVPRPRSTTTLKAGELR